ncbi:aldehyde dehydrogenase family protein [Marinomonas arenicola]|uniref:aldehyde dehydrogenase family protein n=1 Tax=Marinomonas arenicola TaxID=569601 RepID=UPI00311FF1C9
MMKEILNYINGKWVKSNQSFIKKSPVNGAEIARVYEADKAMVDLAVQKAKEAFEGEWGSVSLAERCRLLRKVADIMERRSEELMLAESNDVGVPYAAAKMLNVGRSAFAFRMYADEAANLFEQSYHFSPPNGGQAIHYTLRQPKGVVGAISPWNVPLLLLVFKVAPALAMGNCVIAKPSEVTPQSATLLAEIIEEAGFPAGVFNLVHGFGANSAGAFLTENQDVSAFGFTGDTHTGEIIMQSAAKGVRDVCLELGGKNAGIVFSDANLDDAIAGTLRSAFTNCGQICYSTERMYVERSIFDEFVSRLGAAVGQMKIGAPDEEGVQMGPLVSHQHRDKVKSMIDKAAQDGAIFVTGGGIPQFGDERDQGAFIQPVVAIGLAEDADFVRKEVFGPVCHVTPFDSEEEVIKLSNNSRYGLASSIWTQNFSRAHRVAAKIRAGNVWINDWQLRELRTPMGGVGASGIGAQGGRVSLEFFSDLINVTARIDSSASK